MPAAIAPPWRVYRAQSPPERLFVHGPNGQSVAMVFEPDGDSGPGWSNAHLIAEAPALRAALLAMLAAASDPYDRDKAEVEAVAILSRLAAMESRQ
jgi:hypothetical protein